MSQDTFVEGTFSEDLRRLLNQWAIDAECETPDFLLAQYLIVCIEALKLGRAEVARQIGRTLID